MDKELQTYYEARFDMMSSKGYKDLLTDVETMIEERNNLIMILFVSYSLQALELLKLQIKLVAIEQWYIIL